MWAGCLGVNPIYNPAIGTVDFAMGTLGGDEFRILLKHGCLS